MTPTLNFIAIGICGLIPLIVGAIWYNPKVFGNAVAKLNNVTEPKPHHPIVYFLTYLASFLIAMLIAGIFSTHPEELKTVSHGIFHGGAAAVFMAIPAFAVIALFESKPAKYIFIHAFYWFVSMAVMGGIIGYFG